MILCHGNYPLQGTDETKQQSVIRIDNGTDSDFFPLSMKKHILIKKVVEAVMDCIRAEMPKFINTLVRQQMPSVAAGEYVKIVYARQIINAQEYLDSNGHADLSQLKCLLRKLMPKEYYDEIDKLHEREGNTFAYIVNGGQNLIAPNARHAVQNVEKHIVEK